MIILTLTPGRTGTKKLASILNQVPGVYAEWEPDPRYSTVMRQNQYKPEIGLELVRKKIAIAEHYPVYVDSDHVAVEGFVEHYLHLGVVPNAIVLQRNHRDTALSLYQTHCWPHLDGMQEKWMVHPRDASNLIKWNGWGTAHAYQLCYWYCLEIAARTDHWANELIERAAKVWYTSIDRLMRIDDYNAMLTFFNLPTVESVDQSIVNYRTEYGQTLSEIPPNLNDLENQVIRESLHEATNPG